MSKCVYVCTTLKVRICHSDHMFTVFSLFGAKTQGLKIADMLHIWLVQLWMSSYFCFHTNQHRWAHINGCYQWNNRRNPQVLQHFSAPLDGTAPPPLPSSSFPRSTTPSLHALLFSVSPFPCISSSCVGGRLESPESTTRITRSISETISFSYLFYMVYPSIPLFSLPLSLTCSLWLICVFTLCPSSHSLLLGM